MSHKKVSFLIPGAGRSGTTSLFGYLGWHPEIYTPRIKEINYFSDWYEKGDDWYHSHFSKWRSEKEAGEASTKYMYVKESAKRIYKYNEKMKLIFILRNPTERAISNYKWEVSRNGETRRFKDIIPKRYILPSMYGKHLKRYLKYFEREQIKVVLSEDMKKNTKKVVQDVFKFLDLKYKNQIPETIRKNKDYKPPMSAYIQKVISRHLDSSFEEGYLKRRSKSLLYKIISCANHIISVKNFPSISREGKEKALELLKEDIALLEKIIDKELDGWKNIRTV